MKNQYGDNNIPDIEIAPLSKEYMCLYGVNINLQRAIPLVQDGLKPVQKRLLYQLYTIYGDKKIRVNSVMGDLMKLHPHGDQGTDDTIARMCQSFTNNIPLIEAEGNSGNATSGNDAAAARYLEIHISEFAKDIFFSEFDGKVNMKPSYDNSTVEPFALPSKFPVILLNGTSGIGYTLSSDVLPYNLSEIADATIKLLKNPEAKIHLVPDLPTGCDVYIKDKYTFVMQSVYEFDNRNYTITIKNTPYNKFIEDIDKVLREIQDGPNPIKEILSADDESKLLDGIFKYVIRCKPCNLYNVINTLFKRIPGFRQSISTKNMVVVDTNFNTRKCDVRDILCSWIQYRLMYKRGWYLRQLVTKNSKYQMLEGKAHMLSAKNINKTIETFKKCKSKDEIVPALVKVYNGKVTTSQAKYVSELRMYQLTSDEYDKTIEEMNNIEKEIKEIQNIIHDPNKVIDKIIEEIKEIKKKYGYPRRSRILNNIDETKSNIGVVQILSDGSVMFAETENLEHISSDVTPVTNDNVCLIDDKGYFVWVDTKRIGRNKPITLTSIGRTIMGPCVAAVSNKSNNMVLLTNKGRIKYMGIDNIPTNATKKPLLPLNGDEHIVSVLEIPDESSDIFVYTNDGLGKRFQIKDLNKVTSVDSLGQFILKTDNVSGIFRINSQKPYLVYVTRLGRIRLNHSKYLIAGKKFADPKPIINLTAQDDLVAVYCVDMNQILTLHHVDSKSSTIRIDSLTPTTMSTPPTRPRGVPGVKVIRAAIS